MQVLEKLSKCEGNLKAHFITGFDGCGNHRSYSGKSTFQDGEYVDSKSIVYCGLSLTHVTEELDGETKIVYQVRNMASSDNERPAMIIIGKFFTL